MRGSLLNTEIIEFDKILQTPHTNMTIFRSREENAFSILLFHESGYLFRMGLEGVKMLFSREKV